MFANRREPPPPRVVQAADGHPGAGDTAPRRVLHCIPGMGGGGAERQLAYLAGALVDRGWDVHVALASAGPNLPRLERSGAALHWIAARSNYDPGILWQLANITDRLRPDLVQVWLLQMEILGALAARFRGVPWILSERCETSAYPASIKHWLRERLAAGANAVVSNSPGGRSYWAPRVGAARARHVVPNALPLDEIRAAVAADLIELQLPAGEPLVLFAGRMTEQKQPGVLLAALDLMRDRPVSAVLAGEGPLAGSMRARAEALHLPGPVSFPGYLAELWRWMKRADVFVSPSIFEGHPNTVLEAAASGCPLVVSDIPAHREFLDDSRAVIVPAGDAGAVARGIREVLDRPAAAAARAAQAAAFVAQWSPARMAQEYEQVYLSILDGKAAASGT